jgi:hypothetical protein
LLEIGCIASSKKEQACVRQSAEADETNSGRATPRTTSHGGAPLPLKKRGYEWPLKCLIRKESK